MFDWLLNHPGYLGCTSKGVIAIHADWPVYAIEHGLEYALLFLGQFPPGTKFIKIDDIDQCYLFLVDDGRSRPRDTFAEANFHVALWHEDVLELMDASYTDGVLLDPDWKERRVDALEGRTWQHPDGTWRPELLPDEEEWNTWPDREVVIDEYGFSLTQRAHKALELLLFDERACISDQIMQRAQPALSAGFFDSAIREACVVLECEMRNMAQTTAYGAKLIDDFFNIAMRTGRLISAQLKSIRTEVRTAFRFVRNDYGIPPSIRTLPLGAF